MQKPAGEEFDTWSKETEPNQDTLSPPIPISVTPLLHLKQVKYAAMLSTEKSLASEFHAKTNLSHKIITW